MSDPSPHELPSALSSLFDSPHHFLPAGGDDILIDPQLVSGAATPIETASPVVEVDERERERERERLPRNDGSALDVALVSLAAENERLRRAIAALESGSADSISEAALRELATATVSGSVGPGVGIGVGVGVGVGFGFETLQHQLEQHVQPLDEGSLAGGTSEVAATDFLHGLVTQVSSPSVAPPKSTDPFELTRRALEADIARTREAIAEKEAEIAGVRAGTAPAAPPTDDAAALEAQLSKTATLTETLRRNVGVLRDMAARLQAQHDELREDVDDKAAHLALLEEDARVSADGAAALLEVRGYIEGALKLWRDVSPDNLVPFASHTDNPARPITPDPCPTVACSRARRDTCAAPIGSAQEAWAPTTLYTEAQCTPTRSRPPRPRRTDCQGTRARDAPSPQRHQAGQA